MYKSLIIRTQNRKIYELNCTIYMQIEISDMCLIQLCKQIQYIYMDQSLQEL